MLVPMLEQAGHEVVGLDTDLYRQCTFGEEARQIPTIEKDIRDVEVGELRGFDAVLHLAGLSNDPLGDLNPSLTDQINHVASVQLARNAKQAGVPLFVFSSSCSTYGAAGDDFIDESGELRPVTPYGVSKVRVEQYVSALADEEFSPVFLRNATAYGMSPRIRFDLVVNNLVAWAFTTGKVLLKSDGTPWRPLVHVEDISRAFLSVLEAPRSAVHNEKFNVGITSENYQIREVAEVVEETVPGSRAEFAPGASPDARCYRVNFDRICRVVPGFRPQWDIRKGAKQLYEAYKRIGLKLDDFEGVTYKRVDHIKMLVDRALVDENLRWIGDEVRGHDA